MRRRAQAVLAHHRGLCIDQLVAAFGAGRNVVSCWLSRWQRFGLAGLAEGPRAGQPSNLPEAIHVFLPVYNPEPNRIERLWHHYKCYLAHPRRLCLRPHLAEPRRAHTRNDSSFSESMAVVSPTSTTVCLADLPLMTFTAWPCSTNAPARGWLMFLDESVAIILMFFGG